MQNLFLSFLFFFLSSCTPKKLASSSYTNRRILHEPFVPLDTLSPSEPPKPPPLTPAPSTQNPKHPLSTTPTTSTTSTSASASASTIPTNQNPSPFFPNYPSFSSPPPPSPLAFASFPANISALILPHSPKPNSSHNKLLPVALAAVACAVVVVAISAFFYLRRRRRNFHSDAGDKILASDGTVRRNAVGRREQRHAPSASAEFLYLGTVVNSCVIDDGVGVDSGDSIARKMESPELRPLPPLVRQPSLPLPREYAGSATTAEEEEEFYSPRGSSLGGSGGTESVSRRVFAENSARRSGTSSSCSFSSSVPGSPEQCHSIILSPPMSSSPRRTQQKSPEITHIPNQHTQSSPSTSSFCSSCSNSPLTLSPNRASEKNRDEALSACTNASSSSEERISEKHDAALSSPSPPPPPARLSNASDGNRNSVSSSAFSLPSSPEKVMNNHILDQSPRISSFSDRVRLPELSSLPLSPTLLSSPEIERGFNFNRTSKESVTPQRKHWEIPGFAAFVPPSPPPPPAPPTLQRQRKHWEVQGPSMPVGQPISRPPELVPPSRPFVLQNPATNVSPVELPPNFGEVEESLKPKLKPLHWDKVRTNSDREMVWDQLKSSSFKLNEEMIETLFVAPNPKPKDATLHSVLPNQEERVLDPKKSQNIAILLRALNVTIEEVCEALLEGSTDTLGTELLETLLKMAPSKEEERKLKEHKDDSPTKLDLAEKFLKAVLDVPFAFKRVEAMLYVVNFESEVEYLRKSFQTLEAASEELRNCRMFLKLLEAVLKTGNRMNVGTNRGDAEAFKLDTLLKLADVKGADGKTTLLHFVVQEIIRTEGARLSGTNQTPSSTLIEDAKCRRLGLQVVSNLSSELANVKKAAAMDSEILSSEVLKLSKGIANIAAVVQLNQTARSDENTKKFTESMNKFIKMAEEEIPKIQAQERVAMSLVKEVTEYFHGNLVKEEAHPFRIFMVVRDFLAVLDRVCKEVGMINERTMVSSAHKFPVPVNPMLSQRQQPCNNYDSSDDDSESP